MHFASGADRRMVRLGGIEQMIEISKSGCKPAFAAMTWEWRA